jgi:hypothetical protein
LPRLFHRRRYPEVIRRDPAKILMHLPAISALREMLVEFLELRCREFSDGR